MRMKGHAYNPYSALGRIGVRRRLACCGQTQVRISDGGARRQALAGRVEVHGGWAGGVDVA